MGSNAKKVLVGIILYEPNHSMLVNNLNRITEEGFDVCLIDNTPNQDEQYRQGMNCFKKNDKVCYHSNGGNLGIARALNQEFEYAEKNGYVWVLSFDQDSVMPSGFGQIYLEEIDKAEKDTAIVCPCIVDRNINLKDDECGYVSRCITSGSATRISSWRRLGGFDEYLFIDSVDHDFCDRLTKAGEKIFRTNKLTLSHEIGKGITHHFLFVPVHIRNYPAFRQYYQVRNAIYCSFKNGNYSRFRSCCLFRYYQIRVLLYESDKRNKCAAIQRGYADAIAKIKELRDESSR